MHSETSSEHNPQQSSPNINCSKEGVEGRWSQDQHIQFLKGVIIHGKDWKKIDQLISTRTGSQVRSHAQKYFLKIAKINKQRRRHKNKTFQITQTEQEILNLFTENDISQNTPQQISTIVKKQFCSMHSIKYKFNSESHLKQKQLKSSIKSRNQYFKTKENEQLQKHEQKQQQNINTEDTNNFNLKQFLNYKIDQEEDQDQSYFIHLVKKNMDHFCNGGEFSDLIDFGKSVQAQQTSPRKLSFTAVETNNKMQE